jgi:taurine dioxygenase
MTFSRHLPGVSALSSAAVSAAGLPPASSGRFARQFGEVQIHVMNQYHADGFPELYRLSNLDEHGNPNGRHPDKGTLAWHTDGSWQRSPARRRSSMASRARVRRRERISATCTAPMSASMRVEGAHRQHACRAQSGLFAHPPPRRDPMTEAAAARKPPVDHPIVRTHPETGRKCLYLGDHAEYIVGMPYDEGRALIEN